MGRTNHLSLVKSVPTLSVVERIKAWWNKNRNPHCECVKDCGAGISETGYSVKADICPTRMKRQTAFLRQYPWDQIGKNGQCLEVDDNGYWTLKNKDGEFMDCGRFKGKNDAD